MGGTSRSSTVILAGTISAAILVVANVSVLNVALPELSVELGATQAQGQWMVDIYAVVLASLLLPIGAIGDRFGRRLILLVGLAILCGANAATLALNTPTQVIAARAVSGVGAAFIFPATLSTITATLPDEERSRGVAMWTASVAVGGFLGIIGSGLLIENFWWGSVFLAMAIATGLVAVFCYYAVPDSSDPGHANLDPLGGLLSFLAFGGLVLGIIEGPVEGWTSRLALGGLLVGFVSLIAFVLWELAARRPLLDVRLFRQHGVRAGALSVFTQFVGAFGIFFLVVFYLAIVQGYGPLDIGLSLLPIAVGLLPAAAIAIPLATRYGRRIVGTTGIVIMAAGLAYGATIGVDSGLRHFLISLMTFGFGYGLAGPPATEAIVESLPSAKQGVASALNDVLRELGAAIGIAIAGSAFNSAYRSTVGDLTDYPDEVVEQVREGPFEFARVAPELGEQAPLLFADLQQAVIDGWQVGLIVLTAAVLAGAAGFAAWAPGRRPVPQPETAVPAVVLPEAVSIAVPGPLGAMELAAAAEGELARLAATYVELEHSLEVMALRSATPPDMDTWSATEQVEVAERAAIAMTPPLTDLGRLAHLVVTGARGCDVLISNARAELIRIGRSPHELETVDERIAAVSRLSVMCINTVHALYQRFDGLAVGLSTLRPVARQIGDCRTTLARAEALIQAWIDRPELLPPPPGSATVEADLRDTASG